MTSTEDTGEVRRQLSRAWRAVGIRLLEEGYEPGDVAETMLAVALTTWTGLKDHETAARHLRSIADELAPEDGSEVRSGGVARQRLRFLAAQANRG
ncbi:MAG TPA: hypothetical protein VKB16_09685 [Beijerinckiaceae bacterium]|nr:hypothetical protein [Beijerinckiaceae bacterium]